MRMAQLRIIALRMAGMRMSILIIIGLRMTGLRAICEEND